MGEGIVTIYLEQGKNRGLPSSMGWVLRLRFRRCTRLHTKCRGHQQLLLLFHSRTPPTPKFWYCFFFFEPLRSENIITCPSSLPSPCSVSNRHQLVGRIVHFSTRWTTCSLLLFKSSHVWRTRKARSELNLRSLSCSNQTTVCFFTTFFFHICQRLRHILNFQNYNFASEKSIWDPHHQWSEKL